MMLSRYIFFYCAVLSVIFLSSCGQSESVKNDSAVIIKGGRPVAEIKVNSVRREIARLRRSSAPPKTKGLLSDCLAALQKGSLAPTRARSQCLDRERQIRQQALTTLIQGAWILNQAKAKGLTLTKEEQAVVDRQPVATRPQAQSNYLFFKFTKGLSVPEPSNKDLINIYRSTETIQFTPPRRRALLLIADNQPTIEKAQRLINQGQSPKQVVEALDFVPETEDGGGIVTVSPPATRVGPEIARDPTPLESLIVSLPVGAAPRAQIFRGRYILVQVLSETKQRRRGFIEAKPLARNIALQGQRSLIVSARLSKQWQARTTCAKGWVISPLCDNFSASPDDVASSRGG